MEAGSPWCFIGFEWPLGLRGVLFLVRVWGVGFKVVRGSCFSRSGIFRICRKRFQGVHVFLWCGMLRDSYFNDPCVL